MPFLTIYAPEDFVTTLPAESGGAAAGSAPFSITLKAGAVGYTIEIDDDDDLVDEVGTTQTLVGDTTIGTTTYPSGTTFHSAYDLINTSSGHQVTSVHFGSDGYQQGAVQGLISTIPLEPGVTYTFDFERTSHLQPTNDYFAYTACLTRGTMLRTPAGEVAVETLRPGDLVETLDDGPQPLRLMLSRRIGPVELARHDDLRPVRIAADAMAPGQPAADLHVSPQHRMLVRSRVAARMFGGPEVLVAARKLTELPGIDSDERATEVEYFHLVFDDHQVVFANGAPTESFYPGPMGLAALSPEARAEFEAVFPDFGGMRPARPIPPGGRQRGLVRRHARNGRPLNEG
ncbi:Hint domain-containing protein [Paracoccus zeaxanthinifaciens]|uniref:Hint domain-containing protein n=1 Tax=Paracoccus zeaxanthinifaciens TaxID=187400 RepID=UPI0003B691E4|nr:Hint domain-containing protein [Paracoccus zeaxanthinifaciens]